MTEPAVPSIPTVEVPLELEPAPAPEPGAWREGLSEGLRVNPVLERFNDLDSFATEHINLQKHIGTEKTSLPQPNWKEEDYASHYKALGRPETPEDYDLSGFAPPEGVPWDDEFQNRMVAHLHGAGLNQRQLSQVLDSYSEEIKGQAQAMDQVVHDQNTATEAELRQEWGRAFEEKRDLAKRAFRELGGDDYESLGNLRMADGGLLGSHPGILRIFARLGEEMGEANLVGQRGHPIGFTPEQASSERARLQADPSFLAAYLDKNHPEHGASIKRMENLTAAELGADADRVVP